jgi:hypothetical protein
LKSASGMDLERTYVNAMVNGHQEVLQIIDAMTGSTTPTSGTSSNPYGSNGSSSGGMSGAGTSGTAPTSGGTTGSSATGGTYGSGSTTSGGMSSTTNGSMQLSQQVRDFLMQTRTTVAEHLQKAQELQGQLSMGQGGGTGSH